MSKEEAVLAILEIMSDVELSQVGAVIEDQDGGGHVMVYVNFEVCDSVEAGQKKLEKYIDTDTEGAPTNATIQ